MPRWFGFMGFVAFCFAAAGWLLVPCRLGVSFAAALNFALWRMHS